MAEINEAAAIIMYTIFFAAFFAVVTVQNFWFKSAILGLETLSEFKTDLANEFVQSGCFLAKDSQGNPVLGTFDADALDRATTGATIYSNPDGAYAGTPMRIRFAESIDPACLNTKNYNYYLDIYESDGSRNVNELTPSWAFGSSPHLGYIIPSVWSAGKRVILLEKGDVVAPLLINFGFGIDSAQKVAGIYTPEISTQGNCEDIGGSACVWAVETCDGGTGNSGTDKTFTDSEDKGKGLFATCCVEGVCSSRPKRDTGPCGAAYNDRLYRGTCCATEASECTAQEYAGLKVISEQCENQCCAAGFGGVGIDEDVSQIAPMTAQINPEPVCE